MNPHTEQPRTPLPPFTLESATQKVRLAKDAWNSRDQARVALAYSAQSQCCNRSIASAERKFLWPQGRRPDAHASLSQMGL
jgi:nuclear transport factor 2 (NTF2) superfamily protein